VLAGEIDASTTPSLNAAFLDRPAPADGRFEVDVSEVTFMDSSGLRAFIVLTQQVAASGGTVALCRTPPQVARLIDLAGLDEVLDVRSDGAAPTIDQR